MGNIVDNMIASWAPFIYDPQQWSINEQRTSFKFQPQINITWQKINQVMNQIMHWKNKIQIDVKYS